MIDRQPATPDVAMSFRWDDAANEFGVPGTINADFKRKGSQGSQGSHASLSRFDMHNTLIASGPDFKVGTVDQTPSGNVDLAPTILFLLGLTPPRPMDGRVLREALRGTLVGAGEKAAPVESGEWTAQNMVNGQLYRQSLRWSKVGDTVYLDEGNRQPVAP